MTIYELNTENLTDEQLKLLEELVEESKKKKKAWKPKNKETYYSLSNTGNIHASVWINSMSDKTLEV